MRHIPSKHASRNVQTRAANVIRLDAHIEHRRAAVQSMQMASAVVDVLMGRSVRPLPQPDPLLPEILATGKPDILARFCQSSSDPDMREMGNFFASAHSFSSLKTRAKRRKLSLIVEEVRDREAAAAAVDGLRLISKTAIKRDVAIRNGVSLSTVEKVIAEDRKAKQYTTKRGP